MGQTSSHNVTEIYGKHKGEDIYIIGSGSSMDFFSKKFFENKTVICLNNMYKFFPCNYMLSHHHDIIQEAIDSGATVITSKHNISHPAHKTHNFTGEYYFYEHNDQGFCKVDMENWGKMIVTAGTPVVAALQIAANMGANNVVLCGVDGGTIDKKTNYREYPLPTQGGHPGRVQNAIEQTANMIRQDGVGVCCVLPFVNLTLEGHDWNYDTPSTRKGV